MNISPELQPLYQKITGCVERLKGRLYATPSAPESPAFTAADAKRLRKNQHRLTAGRKSEDFSAKHRTS
jgi:hypothetical protein